MSVVISLALGIILVMSRFWNVWNRFKRVQYSKLIICVCNILNWLYMYMIMKIILMKQITDFLLYFWKRNWYLLFCFEQENDLRYLVENIWSNQSVLSAWSDLYDLVLCRWNKHQEWSPWNCILLTHEEGEAHKKLFSLEEVHFYLSLSMESQLKNVRMPPFTYYMSTVIISGRQNFMEFKTK